jgi:hypothetical protein
MEDNILRCTFYDALQWLIVTAVTVLCFRWSNYSERVSDFWQNHNNIALSKIQHFPVYFNELQLFILTRLSWRCHQKYDEVISIEDIALLVNIIKPFFIGLSFLKFTSSEFTFLFTFLMQTMEDIANHSNST